MAQRNAQLRYATDRLVDDRTGALERGEELVVRDDARPSSGERLVHTLEHFDAPSRALEQIGREQAAERAADNQRPAPDAHGRAPRLWSEGPCRVSLGSFACLRRDDKAERAGVKALHKA